MNATELTRLLQDGFPNASIDVQSADDVHFDCVIEDQQFSGLSRVKQQQLVYAVVNPYIMSGEVHALSLKTLIPQPE